MAPDLQQARVPSRATARLLTVVSLFVPVVLPVAVFYARRARREAAAGAADLIWRPRLIDRPLTFYVVVWVALLALVFVLMGLLSTVFNVSPV